MEDSNTVLCVLAGVGYSILHESSAVYSMHLPRIQTIDRQLSRLYTEFNRGTVQCTTVARPLALNSLAPPSGPTFTPWHAIVIAMHTVIIICIYYLYDYPSAG